MATLSHAGFIKKSLWLAELEPHLNELKGIFVKLSIGFLVLLIVNFYFAGIVLNWFSQNYSIISIKPYDSFNALLVVDFALSIAMLFPFFVYFLGEYISPAFTNTRHVKLISLVSIGLFYLGTLFGFFMFSSYVLNYFTELSTSLGIANLWGVNYLISFVFSNSIIFGFIFQIPLLVFLGIYYNFVDVKKLMKNSVFGVPVVFFASAWITPPDLFSMFLMAVPILGLFYASIFVSILIKKRRR